MKNIDIHIQRYLKIDDTTKGEELWQFYEATFQDIDESSPIAQSFPKEIFLGFLSNANVVKLIATDGTNLCGILFLTEQIFLDSMLSPKFFAKHYSSRKVYQIPVVSVAKNIRGLKVIDVLIGKALDEIPVDSVCVFLHSKKHNQFIPELFKRIYKKHTGNQSNLCEFDTEACCIFTKQSAD